MNKPVVSLLLAVACATAWRVEAQQAPSLDRLVACANVQDSLQRLVCFDREVAPFRSLMPGAAAAVAPPAVVPPAAAPATPALPSPPAVARPVAAPAAAAVDPSANFGAEQLAGKNRPPEPEAADAALHGRITGLRQTSPTVFTVTLDNGQVWRHEDQTLGAYLREGEAVTVRKGALGSYRLTRDEGDDKNWIRVTRIR
jgi:hypothetical protein